MHPLDPVPRALTAFWDAHRATALHFAGGCRIIAPGADITSGGKTMARSLAIAAVGLTLCATAAVAQQRCPTSRPGTNCCDWQAPLAANQGARTGIALDLPPSEVQAIRGPGIRSGAQVYQVCVFQTQGHAGERFIEATVEPPNQVDPPTVLVTSELKAGRCHVVVATTMLLHYTNPDRRQRIITGRTCLLGPYKNRP
jgi:hypothetical protein